MRVLRWALVGCTVLFAVTLASAQTGGITVLVTDETGEPLPGAVVVISHETGSVPTTAERADKTGTVRFPVLRPGGGYSIEVSFPGGGFATVRHDDIRVKISEDITIPVTMLEEFEEQVKVVAESQVIDLDKVETSTRFSDAFIADLPVPGRFYQNVLTMAPGVQDTDGDGNPVVHGSRQRDFQALVGDISNVDPLTGQWMSRVNPNSIEEMEVITSGAGVEFGRAQGGFARIIQKQGSNTHEGVFEFYWSSSKLDGEGAEDTSAAPPAEFDTVQPLFQFSGPIIKDKLWYRASYEERNLEAPRNILSQIAVYTEDTQTIDGQVTWQVSPRNKLAFQYRADPAEENNVGVSSFRPPESAWATERDVTNYSIKWTAPYSPKILVDSTFGWQDLNIKIFPTSSAAGRNSCVPDANEVFLQEAQCFNLTEGLISGPFNTHYDDHRQRLTAKGQATVFGGNFWGMSHQFKLGVEIQNERYFRDLELDPTIQYVIVQGDTGDQDPGQEEEDEPNLNALGLALATLNVPQEDSVRATGTNWAFYAEDQFKPAQNLTLTLGARVDREEINSEGRQFLIEPSQGLADWESLIYDSVAPEYCPDCFGSGDYAQGFFTGYEAFDAFIDEMQELLCQGVKANEIGNCHVDVNEAIQHSQADELTAAGQLRRAENIHVTNTNLSPFLAGSWSPWSNGKTVFKASVGRHYNNVPLVIPLQELNPVQLGVLYEASLTDSAACELLQEENPEDDILCNGTRLRGNIDPSLDIVTVDRDLRTPYQDEFSFKVERELWAETSISLEYINRRYRDQLQDFNVNLDVGDKGRCKKTSNEEDPYIEQSLGHCIDPQLPGYNPDLCNLIDPYTGEMYDDTDPGPGDGYLAPTVKMTADVFGNVVAPDDCSGDRIFILPAEDCNSEEDQFCESDSVLRADGKADLYVQNPFWGEIFQVGNYNESDYEAYVVQFVRRQYRSWEMQASYTYAESIGDGEDYGQVLGDDPSLRDDVRGYQSDDQRHVVKVNATTVTPWGIRLGTNVTWQSGLPYSLLLEDFALDTLPPAVYDYGVVNGAPSRRRQQFPTGGRNDQRNASWWNVDLKATKEMTLGKGLNMQVSAEIFNVLDDSTYSVYNPDSNNGVQVNGINEAARRFGRSWQVGMKLAF
jgi:outer membrane receptor protein involved in Fe transport